MKHYERHHVASGSFYVNTSEAKILQAFLGTCVAIALYDSKAKVGGILHALLPEPQSPSYPLYPEKYLSTGLPICLEKLYEMGATTENLTAYMAGGGLVQPIEKQDVYLNIGGNSVEIANKILNDKGIRIKKSETGGMFGYSLYLNMETWETDINHSITGPVSNIEQAHVPTKKTINQSVSNLQPIPQIAISILNMINEGHYGIKIISHEIKKDQVLSAKILKLSNSSFYKKLNEIESIDDAIMVLGEDLIAKLVISVSVNNLFSQPKQGYSLSKGGLYHHALGTAIISQKLAEITGNANPMVAYTAGLLHDIGKIVLDQYVFSAYPLFYKKLIDGNKSIRKAEVEILGTDHVCIGKKLAAKWGFSQALIDTIEFHHTPEKDNKNAKITRIVSLANLLMHMFNAGPELYRINTAHLDKLLKLNHLSITKFPEIVDAIPVSVLTSSPELAIFEK